MCCSPPRAGLCCTICHGGCNPCQEIVIDMPPPLGRHLGRGAAVGVPVENCDHRIVGIVGPASYIEAGYVARALSWRHPYRGFALWRGCEVRFGDVGWYACARACHFLGGYKYSAFCFQRQLFVKEIGAVSGRCDWQKYAQMACGGSEIWINVMIFALINRF